MDRLLDPIAAALPFGDDSHNRTAALALLTSALAALVYLLVGALRGRSSSGGAGRRHGRAGGSDGKPHVLLLGPEGTGKTVLSTLVVHGETPHNDTVTSMEPVRRTGVIGGGGRALTTITEFPGSAQARNASLDAELASATGIVFLVDARFSNRPSEAQATAQLMKRVLTNPNFVARETPILVAFNKIDMLPALNNPRPGTPIASNPWLQRARDLLQDELDKIKDDMLTSTGGVDDARVIQLGSEEAFEFEVDVASPVSFCVCTTQRGPDGCRDVAAFCAAQGR